MRRLREIKPESELESTGHKLLASRAPYQPPAGAQDRVWRKLQQPKPVKRSRALWLLQPLTVGMLLCGLVAGATAMVGKKWIAAQVQNVIQLIKNDGAPAKTETKRTHEVPANIVNSGSFEAPPTLDPPVTQVGPEAFTEKTVPAIVGTERFLLSHRARREAAARSENISPPESDVAAQAAESTAEAKKIDPLASAEKPVTLEDRERGQTQKILDGIRTLRRDHDPAQALQKLEAYLRDFPDGVYVEEALGFAMEAAFENHDAKATALAQRYQDEFTHGRFRSVAIKILHQTNGN